MKKILLVCNAGMSTSIMMKKMQDYAKEAGIEVEITAQANKGLASQKGMFDVCLIAPQIRFAQDQVAKDLGNIPTMVIDTRIYALADGKTALEEALKLC